MPSPWKRNAVVFLLSQTLSLLGSSLVQYALMWTVTLKTGSGIMMTLYIICGFLPVFFIAPFGGVVADRFDRKKIIMLADGMIALVTLALGILLAAGQEALWLIFVAAAARGAGQALHGPAVGAFLPQVVPQEALTRVNGLNGSIQAAVMLASPVLSAGLMTFAPLPAIFLIDVVTAALAILVLALFLRVPTRDGRGASASAGGSDKASALASVTWFQDMKLGLHYVREHSYLVPFFIYLGLFLFAVAPGAFLTPLQVKRSFGDQVWRLMAIEIAFSLGMMAGGGLVSLRGGFRNRMSTIMASILVMAACTLALGILPLTPLDSRLSFGLYLAFFVLFGVALAFFNTPAIVLLQEKVEDEFLGRVFSVNTMINTSMMPLGMLLFGPLAELVRIEWIMLVTGAGIALLGLTLPFNRALMKAGEPAAAGAGS